MSLDESNFPALMVNITTEKLVVITGKVHYDAYQTMDSILRLATKQERDSLYVGETK